METLEFTYKEDWQKEALCSELHDMFFSDEIKDILEAKEICRVCPVMTECLQIAIEREEPWGVWGGQLFYDGYVVAGKKRPGRPPKDGTSYTRFPEMPIPEHLIEIVEDITVNDITDIIYDSVS